MVWEVHVEKSVETYERCASDEYGAGRFTCRPRPRSMLLVRLESGEHEPVSEVNLEGQ